MQFLYRLTPEEQAIVSEHFAHLESLTAQEVVLLVGRTQDNSPDTFGIVIFQAESTEQARTIMNNDPAVRKGIMRAELFPFRIALSGEINAHV